MCPRRTTQLVKGLAFRLVACFREEYGREKIPSCLNETHLLNGTCQCLVLLFLDCWHKCFAELSLKLM